MDKVNGGGPRFSAADVVELRQYTLHPGTRDTLVRVFEDHFIEGQEQVGIRIGGIFLDDNDPDKFVWFRGFADLDQRLDALQRFYFGPIWAKHRDVANGIGRRPSGAQPGAPTHPRSRRSKNPLLSSGVSSSCFNQATLHLPMGST